MVVQGSRGVQNRMNRRISSLAAVSAAAVLAGSAPALAEMRPSLSFYGVPGIIDMPSGEAMKDGSIGVTLAYFGSQLRTTLTFQITPRISGSYRFSSTRNWSDSLAPGDPLNDGYDTYNDRAFDLRLLLLEETDYLPAVTLGLQDFVGTGKNSAEYIVATKSFGDRLKLTAGLGWGRLGSYNDIGSFGDRPEVELGQGGKPSIDQWFRGPVAPFAGVEWQINDNWKAKAEYSSDGYDEVSGDRKIFERRSPFNFGVEYEYAEAVRVGLYSLYGTEIGFNVQLTMDPKRRPAGGILGPAPGQVGTRPSRSADPAAWSGGWTTQPGAAESLRGKLSKELAPDGLIVEDFSYTATTVHLRVRNTQIDSGPQAIGRTARALSRVMPASVEVFEIVPLVRGMGTSKVTIRRSDLEALEHSPANDTALRGKVQIAEAGPAPGGLRDETVYPRFTWGIFPVLRVSAPLHGDIGLRLNASWGTFDHRIEAGFGKQLTDNLGFRVYGDYRGTKGLDGPNGSIPGNDWKGGLAGIRFDYAPPMDDTSRCWPNIPRAALTNASLQSTSPRLFRAIAWNFKTISLKPNTRWRAGRERCRMISISRCKPISTACTAPNSAPRSTAICMI